MLTGQVINRRSTMGYCTLLGGNLMTCRSKKQTVMTRLSAEVDFDPWFMEFANSYGWKSSLMT